MVLTVRRRPESGNVRTDGAAVGLSEPGADRNYHNKCRTLPPRRCADSVCLDRRCQLETYGIEPDTWTSPVAVSMERSRRRTPR